MEMKFLSAALALLPMIGVALGLGNLFASFVSSVARNPVARPQVYVTTLIGMAVIELLGLLSFVVSFMILFVVK
jgi:F0F1-type ATP synthase membrane subunit c/vacuolar-type H+-ATPase subunit K